MRSDIDKGVVRLNIQEVQDEVQDLYEISQSDFCILFIFT